MILYDALKDREPGWKRELMPEYIECRLCYFEAGEPGGPLATGPARLIKGIEGRINIPRFNEHERTMFSLLYKLDCGHQVAR